MSPMQRTLKWLRENGYQADITEHYHWKAKVRQDLFGFIDVLAVSKEHVLAIQITDASHLAEHRKKIKANQVVPLLLAHMDVEIWSWGLGLTREKRKDGKLNRQKEYLLTRTKVLL